MAELPTMIYRDVNAVCAMRPCTNNGVEIPPACPWKPTETINGVRLCWTHASAVKAGIRPLPVAGSMVVRPAGGATP